MVWVKFHEEITKGAKRGIPRASRFVLMELSLLCRPDRGSVALPLGMSDVNGVCDLLGGNRREVAEALRTFVADGTIVLEGGEGARTLRIANWATWNAGTVEAPGASTQRSREHRSKATATAAQRPLHVVATVGQRSGNDPATSVLHKSREEKSRGEDLPLTPLAPPEPAEPVASPPGGAADAADEPASEHRPKRRRQPSGDGADEQPAGYAAVVAAYFDAFTAARGDRPAFDARAGKAAKGLLASLGEAGAIAAIRAAYADPFWAPKATICTIASDPSRHVGSARPAGSLFVQPVGPRREYEVPRELVEDGR